MRTIGWAAALLCAAATPAAAQVPQGPLPGALLFGCGSAEEVEAQALAHLAAAVPDPGEREAHLQAARAAIARVAALRADLFAGKALEAPYQPAARMAALSAAPSPLLAELFRRTAQDQFARSHLSAATQRVSWAAGLADPARAYVYFVIATELCTVDQDNTRWLKAQVARDGWFTIGKHGADADLAALLLVQHADRDVAFQTEMLGILEPLVPLKETGQSNYAYLYDRVAVNSGRPQRYGTQGLCTAAGTWEPREVEQPDKLDERRAAVGLSPEADYIALFSCGAAPRR